MTTPSNSKSTEDNRIREILHCTCASDETFNGKSWNLKYERYDDCSCLEKIPVIQQEINKAVEEKLLKLKKEMKMHTVPEGEHLITRNYLDNSIDFEISQLEGKK